MKRNLSLLAVLCLCMTLAYPMQQSTDTLTVRPKIGLVLSGGGARGAAHVGVIRLIEEMQIPIDCVVGTSMGAIVGALYAIGYTADDMDSLFMNQDWKMLLSNDVPRHLIPYVHRVARRQYQINVLYKKGALTENSAHSRDVGIRIRRNNLQSFPKMLARPGLIDGKNLMDVFTRLTYPYCDSLMYEKLPRAFACVAADLVTGKEVVLRQGRLAESIRASMSIPGVFYPVYTENQVLVDGGVVNNFPVNVARDMGADIIIGVEVNSAQINAHELQSFASIFERLIGTLGSELHERNVGNTDILLQPQVKSFPVMGFDTVNLRQMIDVGYKTALKNRQRFDSLKQILSVHPKDTSLYTIPTLVPCTQMVDNEVSAERFLVPDNQMSIGLRIDSEDAASALLHIGVDELISKDFKFSLTTRLGSQPWMSAHLAYSPSSVAPQVNMAIRYGYSHCSRHTTFNSHIINTEIYLSDLLSHRYGLRVGLRNDNSWTRTLSGYAPRESYLTFYTLWQGDLYDTSYFPTQGYIYGIEASYNIRLRGSHGSCFGDVRGTLSAVVPLSRTTALLPTVYASHLIGKSIPLVYSNIMGGYQPHRYLRQQLPFVGFTGCELMDRHLVISHMALRQRLSSNLYAYGIINYAYNTDSLLDNSSTRKIWGFGFQIAYNTTIGPLMLCTHWSSLYPQLGVYLSLGFEF